MERNEIEKRVKRTVGSALGVEENEIGQGSRLMPDLGAGSIDIIDINFQLEQEFHIEISSDEFWNMTDDLGNTEYFVDGRMTDAGIAMLRKRFAGFDRLGLKSGDPLLKLVESFSIEMILDYIETKI